MKLYFRVAVRGIVNSIWWESAFIRISSTPSSVFYYFNEEQPCSRQQTCNNFNSLIKLYPDFASLVMDKCVIETEEETTYNFKLIENTFYLENSK